MTVEFDSLCMLRALELAGRGEGRVEPNPMVGCVLARDGHVVGEGWHRAFGGPHAEVEAIRLAGSRAAGATLYVTLEPCCHQGKTPPCVEAILAAGVRRVVGAQRDPFPAVSGGGFARLADAGIEIEVGPCQAEAARLNAPYFKLIEKRRPWIIAKWAMTLDGKIATAGGDSRWVSSPASREIVHALRGRVDAVMVGRQTASRDNPLLTARPAGPRTAVRIVVDSQASLPSDSQLVQTARQSPLLVAVGPDAMRGERQRLETAGCEVWAGAATDRLERLAELLDELGRRRLTNVLVEGGGQLLGSLFDLGQIDEVHAFIAPKLVGGHDAPSPLAGRGQPGMGLALQIDQPTWRHVGADFYVQGRLPRRGN